MESRIKNPGAKREKKKDLIHEKILNVTKYSINKAKRCRKTSNRLKGMKDLL